MWTAVMRRGGSCCSRWREVTRGIKGRSGRTMQSHEECNVCTSLSVRCVPVSLTRSILQIQNLEDILQNLDMGNGAVRNNGGGVYNHCLFWNVMSPAPKALLGELADAIHDSFGSFDDFKTAFSTAAATQFGSGWAWLCVHKGGKVEVCSTPNQDNPL